MFTTTVIPQIATTVQNDPAKIIDVAGLYAPFLLFFVCIIILFAAQRYVTLGIYVTGFAATEAAVRIIKNIVRAPRPANPKPFLGETFAPGSDHFYAFPSGHSAETFYTLAFMWFAAQRIATPAFFYAGAFAAATMVYQRAAYRRHTALQIFAGAVLGALMGWAFSWAAKMRLEKKLASI